MLKITIITVTYNSANTLNTAIESVLGQTYPNIEYIVVDGASKDGTAQLVKSYGDRIAKFVSEPDTGIYNAMNKGLKMATGNYIGYLHADDVLSSPTIVAEMVASIEANHPDVVYGNLEYVAKDNLNKTIRYWKTDDFTPQRLKHGWMPPHPTVYINNDIYRRLMGYDESFKIAADYELMLRLFTIPNLKTVNLQQTMVKMRMGGASNRSLRNLWLKSNEDIRAMKKNNTGGYATLIVKMASKLTQFVRRPNPHQA
jgi:glycosyltransferase involved in cell wall biosynthesis